MTAFTLSMCLLAVASAVGLVFMDRWRRPLRAALLCSVSSLVTLGVVGREAGTAEAATEHPRDTVEVRRNLDGRALLVLAMMSVESGFNPMAVGQDGDTGVLQIRRIYVDEVNRILGRGEYNLLDAYDVGRSLEMFDILQGRHNPGNDFMRTIYFHNKSPRYRDRVVAEYNRLLLYERMRERLIDRY